MWPLLYHALLYGFPCIASYYDIFRLPLTLPGFYRIIGFGPHAAYLQSHI